MAVPGDENKRPQDVRRPLPRVNGKADPAVKKAIQDAAEAKAAADLTGQRAELFGERLNKVEQEARKNKQAAEKAQATADENKKQIDSAIANQQNNSTKVTELNTALAAADSKFQDITNSIQQSLAATSAGLNISIQSLGNTANENRDGIARNASSLKSLQNNFSILKADLTNSLNTLQTNQQNNGIALNSAVQIIEKMQENTLATNRKREEELSLANQKKRNAEAEKELEASRKSLKKEMRGSPEAVSSIGGINWLDKLKSALGILGSGLVISNWETIWGGIQNLAKRWEKLAGYFVSNILKGVLEFTISAFRVGKNIISWIGKKFRQAGNMIKGVSDWFITQGKRGMKVMKRTAEFLIQKLKPLIDKVAQGAGGIVNGIRRGAGNLWNATGGRALNFIGEKAKPFVDWGTKLLDDGGKMMGRIGSSISGMASNTWSGLKDIGGKAFNAVGDATKWGVSQLQDLIMKSPLGGAVKGITSFGKDIFSNLFGAAKAGPEAMGAFFNNLGPTMSKFFGGIGGKLGMLKEPLANLARFAGGTTALSKLARGSVLLDLPINFLINHLLRNKDPYQSFMQALGSAAGSLAGGLAVGASTGGLAGFAGAVAGGEIGEALLTAGHNYFLGTQWTLDGNLAAEFMKWAQGMTGPSEDVSVPEAPSIEGADLSNGAMGKMDWGISGSPSGGGTDTSYISSPGSTYGDTPVSQILPNPKRQGSSTSNSVASAMANVSSTTLPAQVISSGPERKSSPVTSNSADASTIPPIASSHPGFAFYEMFAKEIFDLGVA